MSSSYFNHYRDHYCTKYVIDDNAIRNIERFLNNKEDYNNIDNICSIFGLRSERDYSQLIEIGRDIRENFDHLLIIGIGGTIAIIRAITDFCYIARNHIQKSSLKHSKLSLHFLYTLDHTIVDKVLYECSKNNERIAILVASKSGYSAEVIVLLEYCNNKLTSTYKEFEIYLVTQLLQKEKKNILLESILIKKKIAHHITFVDYDIEATGRFSIFAAPNLIILAILSCNSSAASFILHFLQGGRDALYRYINILQNDFIHYIDQSLNNTSSSNDLSTILINIRILMWSSLNNGLYVSICSSPKTQSLLEWYALMLAETMGKRGCKIIPLVAVLPFEQHGHFQNYLETDLCASFIHFREMNNMYAEHRADANINPFTKNQKKSTQCYGENSLKRLMCICELEAERSLALRHIATPQRVIKFNYGFRLNNTGSNSGKMGVMNKDYDKEERVSGGGDNIFSNSIIYVEDIEMNSKVYQLGELMTNLALEAITAAIALGVNPFQQKSIDTIKDSVMAAFTTQYK